MPSLREDQIQRYARHIVLPHVGGVGQLRLLRAQIGLHLCNPAAVCAATYLAAAGIGHLVIRDQIQANITQSDVQQGILFEISDVGRNAVYAFTEQIGRLNPDVAVTQESNGQIHFSLDATIDVNSSPNSVEETLIEGGKAAQTVLQLLLR